MPDMVPVGNTNYVPDINKTLQPISTMLGLQQQQQELQSTALKIRSQQAGLVSQEQQARETQAGAQLLADPIGNGLVDPDGNVLPTAQAKIMQAMPTTGSAHYDDLLKAAKGNVEYKNAQVNLRSGIRQDVNGRLMGVALDEDSGAPEIHDTLKQINADYAGTGAEKDVATITRIAGDSFDDTVKKHDVPAGKSVIKHWAQGGLARTDQVGPGGLATPERVNTAAGTSVSRNRMTGAISQQPGAPTGSDLNPSSPKVAAATAEATGGAEIDVARAKQVGDLQQQSRSAVGLTQQADRLKDEIDSGHLAAMLSKGAAYLGFTNINEARAQLTQDVGKMKGLVADRAGSDSRANTILEGYPDDKTPTNTFHADMDYLRGVARQNLARGTLLQKYQTEKGPRGFAAADNFMTNTTSPLMHEYNALKPDERAAFYKHNFTNAQDAQAFKDEVTKLKRHTRDVLD